ncbi:MAG: MogA/MoaB family molybdenum cofactor biosynthesis protein [Nitrososphaeria archaeon]|nr:MogA/MoaB family molybdenum cofactor biosynthesis protein [Nitrososphaeria archaeon]
MKSYESHRSSSPTEIYCSVITVSSSRYEEASKGHKIDDLSGLKIVQFLTNKGYHIRSRKIVPDNIEMIRKETLRSIYEENCDVIILTGGTGIASSDVTVEALSPLFIKSMPGFGEIFRIKSFDKAKSAAIISRATAGIISGKIVFCLPGSPDAVEIAMEILCDELPHIVKHARE